MHFISTNIDKKNYVSCIFLDLRKAFDSVNHNILILKLKKLGITGCNIELLKSYLSNRKQFVSIDGVSGSTETPITGVPQGSILGPCLFNIFINDLALVSFSGVLQLYADDATLIYKATSKEDLYYQMQNDLLKLMNWLDLNHLILNHDKTKYMIFGKANLSWEYSLTYKNFELKKVSHISYLGLIIDNKLSWKNHIDHIKKLITPYIFVIKKLKQTTQQHTLMLIYNSFILSRLTYLNPIWSRCVRYKINEVDVLHKRVLKIILGVSILYPTQELYSKFTSFNIISERELLIVIYKMINNLIKHNFNLTKVSETHSHDTRRRSHFSVEYFATSISNNNVSYTGLSKFNSLPTHIRRENNIFKFKKLLTNHLRVTTTH